MTNLMDKALDKVREYVIYAFLFTVPLFFLMDVKDLRLLQERYFQMACMLVGSLFFGNIWLTLFMWLNLILFVVHGGVIGASQVLSVFLTGILFASSRNFFATHSFKKFATALYIAASISIFLMILQTFGMDPIHVPLDPSNNPIPNDSSTTRCGMFSLPPFNAIFLTITGSLILFLANWKWIGLLLLIPVIDARCSASILAWTFLLPFWVYWQGYKLYIPFFRRSIKIFYLILIMAPILFGVYTFKDWKGDKLTYNSRFESWHMMFKYSCVNLLGWGPDSFRNYNSHKDFMFKADGDYKPIISNSPDPKTEILRYYSADPSKWNQRFKGKIPESLTGWGEAHNDYLQYLFEYGIFGILFLIGFFKEIYDRFILSDKNNEVLALFACICVYGLVAITQFPFHLARISGIFGIILGAYWAKTDEQYQLIKGEYNA